MAAAGRAKTDAASSQIQSNAAWAQFTSHPFTTRDSKVNSDCHAELCRGEDTSPYTTADMYKVVVDTWNWKQAYCKLDNGHGCLWKFCNDGNLTKAALVYLEWQGINDMEAAYCFHEHCGNEEFDLQTTTLSQAQRYCDRKFSGVWRRLMAGPGGYGWPGQGVGTGVWPCAHANYHCDWAYCKLGYCNNPRYQAIFGSLKGLPSLRV